MNVGMLVNDRSLVLIPTYNESKNVVNLYRHIKSLHVNLDILFIDDNSPDKTGEILEELAIKDPNLFVVRRNGKLGIGSAHKHGIAWAYNQRYTVLITMDSDYSHAPDDIERLLQKSEIYDVVIGSRFQKKGGMGELSLLRQCLSFCAHLATKYLLGLPYDCTNAFRLYRLDKIQEALLLEVKSDSYSFFIESIYKIKETSLSVAEIPIKLGSRAWGESNMSTRDALLSIRTLVKLLIDKYRKYFH